MPLDNFVICNLKKKTFLKFPGHDLEMPGTSELSRISKA